MTPEQFKYQCEKIGERAFNLLPIISFGGWEGHGNGFTPYLHWRETKCLASALIELSISNSAKRIELIKDIKNTFYGSEENFTMYRDALVKSLPSLGVF